MVTLRKEEKMADKKAFTRAADRIKSQLTTGAKTYTLRDSSDRITHFYEASTEAETGTPCLLTMFKYVDGPLGTSRHVLATKEFVVDWDSTWDFEAQP